MHINPPFASLVYALEQQLVFDFDKLANDSSETSDDNSSRPHRFGWANLLAHIFTVDVTLCCTCSGRMHIVEVVHPSRKHRSHHFRVAHQGFVSARASFGFIAMIM